MREFHHSRPSLSVSFMASKSDCISSGLNNSLSILSYFAENEYNLNIPRYVDTFEEEEPIDIQAVMSEIKELEFKRNELDKEIEKYLKELGL